MEKIQYDIIADIRDLLDSLKKQAALIEARLAELEEAAEEQVEDIALETLAGEIAVEQEPSADDLPDDDAVPMPAGADNLPDGIAAPTPAADDLPGDDAVPIPAAAEETTDTVSGPADAPAPEPETTAEADDIPIDIAIDMDDFHSIGEIAAAVAPVPEPVLGKSRHGEPSKAPAAKPAQAAKAPAKPAQAAPGKSINDTAKARKTVADAAREKQAWRKDIPGTPVKNIISAISLADRALLINTLFKSDPIAFNDAITAFNGMKSFAEAEQYISENHPGWNMNSDIVYRLMMAIRRKLR